MLIIAGVYFLRILKSVKSHPTADKEMEEQKLNQEEPNVAWLVQKAGLLQC